MELQKRLAANALKCGPNRIRFDPEKRAEIKEAITTFDVKRLINKGIIIKLQSKGVSRARAKKIQSQKRKGRQAGHGSRKGKATARQNPKDTWIAGVRTQRKLIKKLRDNQLIDKQAFRDLYGKVKGGFFRSTKHIKIYIKEQEMIKRK
ncbi:50S ribosomal protein L19e [uncultured archaeon]|nr:50S ribosomal protein L19e [uncultured archaeon]